MKTMWSVLLVASALGGCATRSDITVTGLVEVRGGGRVVSPTFYGLDLSGTYYNPKLFQKEDTLLMYVQGGQFEKATSPVDWCAGDGVILYSAPYTADGLWGPFEPIRRITPCPASSDGSGDPQNFHYTAGNLVFDEARNKYYMISTRVDWPDAEEFKDLLQWESPDGIEGQWRPFLEIDSSVDVDIETTLLLSDASRTKPSDGFEHSYFRGFARQGFAETIELRLDVSPAHCRHTLQGGLCQLIEFKKDGVWTAAANGVLKFEPDVLNHNFKPWGLSKVYGQLQLWGSESVEPDPGAPCGKCRCDLGSKIAFYRVNSCWELEGPYHVGSNIRCAISDIGVARVYPWLVQFEDRLFLYSATNGYNLADVDADGVCNLPENGFVGMYIVVTELQPDSVSQLLGGSDPAKARQSGSTDFLRKLESSHPRSSHCG